MKWGPEDIEEAKRLWMVGHSAGEIGHRLGRTRSSVIGRLNRSGVLGTADRSRPPAGAATRPRKEYVRRAPQPRLKVAAASGTTPSARVTITGAGRPPFPLFVGRKLPPRAPSSEPPPRPTCDPVPFVARQEHQCGWIIGEARGPSILVCGAEKPRTSEVPYCEYHAHIARPEAAAA